MTSEFGYYIDPYPGGPWGNFECGCTEPGCACPYAVKAKADQCAGCEMGSHYEEWDNTNRAAGHDDWDDR